jgi:hypothetical protein
MNRTPIRPLFNEQYLYTELGKQLRDEIMKFLRSKLPSDVAGIGVSPREFAAVAHAAVERVVQQALSKL